VVWDREWGTSKKFHHPFTHNQRIMHITVRETLTTIFSFTIVARKCPSPVTFLLKTDSAVIISVVNKRSRKATKMSR